MNEVTELHVQHRQCKDEQKKFTIVITSSTIITISAGPSMKQQPVLSCHCVCATSHCICVRVCTWRLHHLDQLQKQLGQHL